MRRHHTVPIPWAESVLTNRNDLGLVYYKHWSISLKKWPCEASCLTGKDSGVGVAGGAMPDTQCAQHCFGQDWSVWFPVVLRTKRRWKVKAAGEGFGEGGKAAPGGRGRLPGSAEPQLAICTSATGMASGGVSGLT